MADTGRKRPAEILTEDEVRRLLAACSRRAPTGIRDRALITVMYRAGLRISEALALRPADIDHEHGTIRVLHGKGDKSRTVGIDEGALAVVDVWAAERKRLGINGRATLFCTLKGGPMSDRAVRYMLARRADEKHADIGKHVRPHGLRHTMAVEWATEGKTLPDIQHQLGHSSAATTDVYLRGLSPRGAIDAARSRDWDPGH